jgi:hypothetical protein
MSQAVMGGYAGRRSVGGRTMSEGVFGIIAIVLGIIGLADGGAHPDVALYVDAIAGIALGISLVAVGAALAASYGRVISRVEGADASGGSMAGTSMDGFLGAAVVILGILALLRIVPWVLIPVQVLLIGAGMIFNGAASVRLANLEAEFTEPRLAVRRVLEEVVFATASVRMVSGVAVMILGILSVVGTEQTILTLVAMLVAGTALLLNSTSLSSRMLGVLVPRQP